MFSASKAGQMAQILLTGAVGQIAQVETALPSPDQIQTTGQLVIQVLVAVVTIWATIRKALQKPQAVVKVIEPGRAEQV